MSELPTNKEDVDIVDELEGLAISIFKHRKEKRRPIVIEFCGTPKAGKTSCF